MKAKNADLVSEFQSAYEDAVAECRKAMETTGTDGWQKLYADFMAGNEKRRIWAADQLDTLADSLRREALSEDDLKELKAAVKNATEACDAAASFDLQTVAPIRGTVEALSGIIGNYEQQAASMAARTPLTEAGLPDRLADAIHGVPKASWNPRVGCISIKE